MMRAAVESDKDWIKAIYKENTKELGSFNLFFSWDDYLKGKGWFLVVPEKAFVRYTYSNKNKMFVIQEIAVKTEFKGQGLGKMLFDFVPKPVYLKCNQANVAGNAFYQRQGMRIAGTTQTKKGVAQNIYVCAV